MSNNSVRLYSHLGVIVFYNQNIIFVGATTKINARVSYRADSCLLSGPYLPQSEHHGSCNQCLRVLLVAYIKRLAKSTRGGSRVALEALYPKT